MAWKRSRVRIPSGPPKFSSGTQAGTVIQITQGGVTVGDGDVVRLRTEYETTGIALMPGFFSPPVLNALLKKLETSDFNLKREAFIKGSTLILPQTDPALIGLHFALNRPEVFQLASQITGIPKPGNFLSRLHRTVPDPELQLEWHDDASDGRVLGLNINLSRNPYSGGLLQIRNPGAEVLAEVGQLPPGDAFLFRIGNKWQHRLTPVESGERTVAVGWFRLGSEWNTTALHGFRRSMILSASEAHQ